MLFLSIIIPAYNSQKTIIPLLVSIVKSRGVDFGEIEIIIVDDKSTDATVETVQRCQANTPSRCKAKVKIISLKKNGGPANARNIGVKYAKGKIVLFLDADVKVYKNTLFEIIRSFKTDKDLFALTGVWDKNQRSRKFFPKFKALRDWSYWINERDPKNYYYLFSTRVAAINRGLFLRLAGFDTTYKAALIEDIELTYRIARRYAVVFNPKVIVHHEFEDFWPVAKKYFRRSYYWSKIYRERKKFDPVATTSKEAITTISAAGVVILTIASVISRLGNLNHLGLPAGQASNLNEYLTIVTTGVLAIHLYGVRKFLLFCAKEEGIWFALRAFIVGIALYLVILAGAVVFWLNLRIETEKMSLK